MDSQVAKLDAFKQDADALGLSFQGEAKITCNHVKSIPWFRREIMSTTTMVLQREKQPCAKNVVANVINATESSYECYTMCSGCETHP